MNVQRSDREPIERLKKLKEEADSLVGGAVCGR